MLLFNFDILNNVFAIPSSIYVSYLLILSIFALRSGVILSHAKSCTNRQNIENCREYLPTSLLFAELHFFNFFSSYAFFEHIKATDSLSPDVANILIKLRMAIDSNSI
jgi:hypothetical protein